MALIVLIGAVASTPLKTIIQYVVCIGKSWLVMVVRPTHMVPGKNIPAYQLLQFFDDASMTTHPMHANTIFVEGTCILVGSYTRGSIHDV